MSNVIRPDFGRKPADESPGEAPFVFQALHVFGDAAGYRVCLVHDEGAAEGDVLKVVVGRVGGCDFEPVSILPNTQDGRSDAASVGLAILRTLEIIENAPSSAG
ncbi:hypothetical protein [Methylobacterium nigriterrae]|uniref:hypothetical protein n=1 Tax=Methylobacterium nigriterrae TaxID=3127512 RepID=UPI0030136B20